MIKNINNFNELLIKLQSIDKDLININNEFDFALKAYSDISRACDVEITLKSKKLYSNAVFNEDYIKAAKSIIEIKNQYIPKINDAKNILNEIECKRKTIYEEYEAVKKLIISFALANNPIT